MQHVTVDRRISSRRSVRHGGRRASDQPIIATTTPVCSRCGHSATILAGEAEGGWWFVCDACDHMWDQRLVANRLFSELDIVSSTTTRSKSPSGSWLPSAALTWWRLALGRTTS